MSNTKAKNTICLWFNKDAQDAARFYATTFPNSEVTAIHKAPGDFPGGKEGEILTVEFTVFGIPCLGLNGGPEFSHTEAFSFQIATDTQEETDRYWKAIVSNGGQESACGWCKDRWGISWQITPRVLTDAMAAGGAEAKRAFAAMMEDGNGQDRHRQNRGRPPRLMGATAFGASPQLRQRRGVGLRIKPFRPIPKGLRPPAQGWRASAYHGSSFKQIIKPQRGCGECRA